MGTLGKEPCSCFVSWFLSRPRRPFVFTKVCMPPWRRLPSLGSKVVDGFGTLGIKGGSAGVGQVAPARFLPGLWTPLRHGPCQGSSPRPSTLCVSGLALLWLSCVFASSAPPSVAAGVATTARAQVNGNRRPLLLYTDRSPRAWATHKHRALLGQA